MTISVRRGQAPKKLERQEFKRRYLERFIDPAFDVEREAIERLEAIAWRAHVEGRKAPHTTDAGPGFDNPRYKLSLDWLAAREAVRRAEAQHADPVASTQVLLVAGGSRNDATCPSEMSKTFRLAQLAREAIEAEGGSVDLLDLSALCSEPLHHIHPCKGCVSTAMPLCHWPCSCYPNHEAGQTNDAMNALYPRWARAHGVLILTPVYWFQAPSPLKLMMDRLVCANGGNPDPTSTDGKDAKLAKQLELGGWPYPNHLRGRAYGVVVHGDVEGAETLRRALCDWFGALGFVHAGAASQIDRYIGYYEPYATSHEALDDDTAIQEETRNAARAVLATARGLRTGELRAPDRHLSPPRKK